MYLINLSGSGVLSEGSNPLILSPRKEGISFPSTISIGLDLGLHLSVVNMRRTTKAGTYFANCPAIRAILTTGLFAPGIP